MHLVYNLAELIINIVGLTKAFLLKFLRISPVMRSNPGVFWGLRLVLISSATSLRTNSGIFRDNLSG
jgi:hypothetical protein